MATQDQQNRNSIPQSRQSLQGNLSQQTFKVRGMKTDLSESSFENEYAFENKNMRINVVDEDNTLMNLTNERGTKFVGEIEGIPIGVKRYASDKALVFATNNTGDEKVDLLDYESDVIVSQSAYDDDINNVEFKDSIYDVRQNHKGDIVINKLSEDSFGFSAYHPLEIEHYNDGAKDNFYLADGINNFKTFVKEGNVITCNKELSYNAEITGRESISYEFVESKYGEFYSGAIVYCFSYITKQGHKTGIIDVSDIIYLSGKQRDIGNGFYYSDGLAPNEKWRYIINVKIANLSSNFDRVELYSLYRSTLNGEITVRKYSCDISSNQILCSDYNKFETCSYGELLSNFNSILIPSTMTTKNSVLFLGDIRTNNYSNIYELFVDRLNVSVTPRTWWTNDDTRYHDDLYRAALSGNDILVGVHDNYFLNNNKYFYGLQFQDKFGNWSPVIYLCGTSSVGDITLNVGYVRSIKKHGYVAVRAMMLDDKRIRNTVCEGVLIPTLRMFVNETKDNGVIKEVPKYGIDYYSPYFVYDVNWNHDVDIYGNEYTKPGYEHEKGYKIKSLSTYVDLYSPDIEFDENFNIQKDVLYDIETSSANTELKSHKIDTYVNGNAGLLYNNTDLKICSSEVWNEQNSYIWYDAINGYQKALQLILNDGEGSEDKGEDIFLSLYELNRRGIKEKISKYKIYTWQPSGSLNDSKNSTSVLKYKRIFRKYRIYTESSNRYSSRQRAYCYMYDGTSSNIPVGSLVYAGSVNQKIYPDAWGFPNALMNNYAQHGGNQMWDGNQIQLCDGYSPATAATNNFIGQPIEIWRDIDNTFRKVWEYCALGKLFDDGYYLKDYFKMFRGYNNDDLNAQEWDMSSFRNGAVQTLNGEYFANKVEFIQEMEAYPESDNARHGSGNRNLLTFPIKVRVSNNYNRDGNITMAYKTARHIVAKFDGMIPDCNNKFFLLKKGNVNYELTQSDIETGHWIICSKKVSLGVNEVRLDVDINECYTDKYSTLKTEPYSLNDENQVTCVIEYDKIKSYFNPMCRYGLQFEGNGMTSATYNKINNIYNQKNNFFIFSGITKDTVTDDKMNRTMLYSDMKVENEKEDSWVNFNTTNFYTFDNYIKDINKLITFNDKLLAFSDDAIVQVLYNENVVINTDSVQSLGLASTDKITGIQLVSNTYGCLNKWSVGAYNNVLYFSDDLNNKAMSYNGEFISLYESLGIETYNKRLLKKRLWNPVDWNNTKLNIDALAKDIHYTGSDIDIALNTMIGNFTSLYSYEAIPYIENIGDYSVALKNVGNETEVYLLRQGEYNMFWGKDEPLFEPYWSTVIINQNSLVNKMLSSIEFSTEAYGVKGDILLPVQNFTFDHVTFWNDYQENKLAVDYKMYGQSLLKKKFRIWRINRFRDSSRMLRRNYDRMANTWHYLKLSNEKENMNKLTLHWLNVNYN